MTRINAAAEPIGRIATMLRNTLAGSTLTEAISDRAISGVGLAARSGANRC